MYKLKCLVAEDFLVSQLHLEQKRVTAKELIEML